MSCFADIFSYGIVYVILHHIKNTLLFLNKKRMSNIKANTEKPKRDK